MGIDDWQYSAAAGLCLVVFGGWLIRSHVVSWRDYRDDESLDDIDRQHYANQYRRRMQASGAIVFLGIMIPLTDSPWMLRLGPFGWSLCVITILIVTFWIFVLAMGDMTATRVHSQVATKRLQRQQRELEDQLARIKKRGSNGHPIR